jgi:hypothetical protein
MGMTVKTVYESAHIAIGATIPYAIELRISITRPAKKRKTDRWRRAGRTSTYGR